MEESLSKLMDIKNAVNAKFYEREKEVEALLIALLARQHILLIGPAGTAKSALAIEFAKIIDGGKYFQWLLTRFSTPEEVFGPLSLKDLEHGIYKRNTETKMPEAHLVFLDEIFKANSAILNSLLTIINERLFYNGGTPTKVPLISVIGASNEYPEEGEGLEALFDRFLFRYEVDYIENENNFLSMLKNEGTISSQLSLKIDELTELQALADNVIVSDEVYTALARIRKDLRDEGIRPSDRRFKQSIRILQARALINKRGAVKVDDLVILENVLWELTDERGTTSVIVRRHAMDYVIRKLDSIQSEAIEVFNIVLGDQSEEAGMEGAQKMKSLITDLTKFSENNPDRASEIDRMLVKVKAMQEEVLTYLMEPLYSDGPAKLRKMRKEASSFYYNS
ncbi:AAA family ATPase [Sporosarcina oncorhynchi]|uniref:AAA family ATPase n=1 Tax=Sporosarcina oncorhynchi TaxID=3056444 RepID=A0ABZ0L295_9BACL|nr:AAA family ATPase [Sporosarcina sp. T2O-4]WOV86294.1 AAA family ATPase [Sporosarcina sp. T2O-4]